MAIKTVELVWSGTHWCDRFTGVKIPEGIYPPPDQQAEMIGTTLEEWAGKGPPPDYHGGAETVHQHFAELFQSGHHPFDKSFTVTYEQVQKMINDAFDRHVIPENPPYIMEDRWLVTYEWLRREGDFRQAQIDQLHRQVDWLSRPWYKRWFSR